MFIQSAARVFAAATLVVSLVLAGPFAFAAPATTEPAMAAAKADPVEAHIKELHNKLHITAAKQTQWDSLVQVMRDNAKAMTDLQKQRGQDASAMTAVDAIKSYQAVIAAHEAGMAKFVPAFQALYNSMSSAQKETADSMFRGKVRAAATKKST
ncbi:MAG: Spy/CpxP family protein refolding chaperone [Candidatus Binataceae bacterium]